MKKSNKKTCNLTWTDAPMTCHSLEPVDLKTLDNYPEYMLFKMYA